MTRASAESVPKAARRSAPVATASAHVQAGPDAEFGVPAGDGDDEIEQPGDAGENGFRGHG
jgi:hypothetical protein